MKVITEDVLWEALDEALERKEIGLIIWSSWTEWINFSYQLHEGNDIYKFILKKIKNNESANVIGERCGIKMANILAVPVKGMIIYEKFFENILSICQKCNYNGPITFVESNEIAKCFE